MSTVVLPDTVVITPKGAMLLDNVNIGEKILNSNGDFVTLLSKKEIPYPSSPVQAEGVNILPTVIEDKYKNNLKAFKQPFKNDKNINISLNKQQSVLLSHILLSKFEVDHGVINLPKSRFKTKILSDFEQVLSSLDIKFVKEEKAFITDYSFEDESLVEVLSLYEFKDLPYIVSDFDSFFITYIKLFKDLSISPSILNTADIILLYNHTSKKDLSTKSLLNEVLSNSCFNFLKQDKIVFNTTAVIEDDSLKSEIVTLDEGELVFNLLFYNLNNE